VESGAVSLYIHHTLIDRAQADQMKKQKIYVKRSLSKAIIGLESESKLTKLTNISIVKKAE
jgi:hypothetical protein